jgi:hypothetical protein
MLQFCRSLKSLIISRFLPFCPYASILIDPLRPNIAKIRLTLYKYLLKKTIPAFRETIKPHITIPLDATIAGHIACVKERIINGGLPFPKLSGKF